MNAYLEKLFARNINTVTAADVRAKARKDDISMSEAARELKSKVAGAQKQLLLEKLEDSYSMQWRNDKKLIIATLIWLVMKA